METEGTVSVLTSCPMSCWSLSLSPSPLSDHDTCLGLLPGKRQALSSAQAELEEVVREIEVLSQKLHGERSRVEEARSSLQAHHSR